ncbi:MAG TPA: serine/threonine-protein kinase [Pyrinomonadaceae bacterium]|nr:serine/threonine-protein kinase [Pyrinomonadaceae bacterium]
MQKRFQTNEMIGEYCVTAFLGAGGMGEVYKGVHTKPNRPAAIKVLSQTIADESFTSRFFNEAQLQASLHHPNVAALYDFSEINGQLFIFMEFVDGESLEDLVDRRAFTVDDALKTFQSICEAVAYIHSNGIVHRDIKAQNVKLSANGTVKMLDFGIAKSAASHDLTQAGGVIGTPHYLAPEQLNGQQANERTDIWALGILLYEMLTGATPFAAETLGALCQQITTANFAPPEQSNPAVSRPVSKIVARCLKKNPAERYQTADELLKDLRRLTAPNAAKNAAEASQDFASAEFSDAPRTAKKSLPVGLIAGLSAVAVFGLFLVGGVVFWLSSGGDSTKSNDNTKIVAGEKNLKSNQAVVVQSVSLRRVKIDVDEGKAEIVRNGEKLGSTPFDLEARDGEKVDLTLRRDGFEDKPIRLEVKGNKQVYTFSLKQK